MHFTTFLLGAALSAQTLALPSISTSINDVSKRYLGDKFDAWGWVGTYSDAKCKGKNNDGQPNAVDSVHRPEFPSDNSCVKFTQDTEFVGAWFGTGSDLTRAIVLYNDDTCTSGYTLVCPNSQDAACWTNAMSTPFKSFEIPTTWDCKNAVKTQ